MKISISVSAFIMSVSSLI